MATLGALGVVYGDIGTSPLYALREAAKAASGESMPTPEAVLGTVSLITWSLIVIISLKYAVLMLRAARRACLTGWHYASMADPVSGFQGSRESANFQASSGVVGMSLRHNDHGAAERRSKIVPERKPHADPP
jgi:K+ potassium transporter